MSPGRRLTQESLSERPAVDASMTLLNEVMHRPLDPSYAAAAERKAAGAPPRRRPAIAALCVLAVLLGLLTATAAVQLRAPQPAMLAARTLLEDEITNRRDQVAVKVQVNTDLQESIDALRNAALGAEDPDLLERLRADSIATGAVAVHGPGLTVTLEDGATADVDAKALVQDTDLQLVVNALWAAGAEAIAVNGQRLTATTAIRSAGSAILVDLVGLSGPYEVTAIGDRNGLETGFARSAAMQRLEGFASTYGIRTTFTGHEDASLPAGNGAVLFSARVIDDDNGSQ